MYARPWHSPLSLPCRKLASLVCIKFLIETDLQRHDMLIAAISLSPGAAIAKHPLPQIPAAPNIIFGTATSMGVLGATLLNFLQPEEHL